jgi:hypothetical protein
MEIEKSFILLRIVFPCLGFSYDSVYATVHYLYKILVGISTRAET